MRETNSAVSLTGDQSLSRKSKRSQSLESLCRGGVSQSVISHDQSISQAISLRLAILAKGQAQHIRRGLPHSPRVTRFSHGLWTSACARMLNHTPHHVGAAHYLGVQGRQIDNSQAERSNKQGPRLPSRPVQQLPLRHQSLCKRRAFSRTTALWQS